MFPARLKLIFQFLVASSAVYWIMMLHTGMLSGGLAIPFFKEVLIPLGYSFIAFGAFVVVGSSNAVNLTDGLDGLAIVPVMIASGTFLLIAYLVGNVQFSNYLQIGLQWRYGRTRHPHGRLDRRWVGLSLVQRAARHGVHGRCRDSLRCGSVARCDERSRSSMRLCWPSSAAFSSWKPSPLSSKWSRSRPQGGRVFKMAPIHHHFEQLGWREPTTIVIRFWIISVVLALIGLSQR